MPKRLYRSRTDRMIFGVCGGLGEYFDIDPVIMRLIFVVLGLWGGAGILLYLIGALVIPENPTQKSEPKEKINNEEKIDNIGEKMDHLASEIKNQVKNVNKFQADQVLGLVVIFVGLSFLAGNLFPWFTFGRLWPLLMVLLGIAIIVGSVGKEQK